ncbi:MAG: hypothetical protein AAFR38_00835 [Planctomycetota bacterium]
MSNVDGIHPDRLCEASRLRAIADGELDLGALGHEGESGRRVEFERGLREACGRAMCSGEHCASPELRARVEACLREQAEAERAAVASGLEARASETRSASFWQSGGFRLAVSAVAAVLVIGAGTLYIGSLSGFGSTQGESSFTVGLARFVADEHTRTLNGSAADAKFGDAGAMADRRAFDDAVERMATRLEARPSLPETSDMLAFRGTSGCRVPGEGKSAHAQFVHVSEKAGETTISVFVKQADGMMGLELGKTYEIDGEACEVENARIICWTDGNLTYALVASTERGGVCDGILADLGLPAPTESLR